VIDVPSVFMVGGSGRRVGKTAFSCAVIERFSSQRDVVGVKISTIDRGNSRHHASVADCPPDICRIDEETALDRCKDTSRMLASGAKRAVWLQVTVPHLAQGISSLLDRLGPDVVSVWESTRARRYVAPGVFIMVDAPNVTDRKPWAEALASKADRRVSFAGAAFNLDWRDIRLDDARWTVRIPATAVVLAGGGSTRMGADKALLSVGGKTMLEHISNQLAPWFRQIIVSSNEPVIHGFVGAMVVPDRIPGCGPLMGIASALEATSDPLCFVTACDTPAIDINLIRAMVSKADGYDAVVPYSERPEPLFAVYNKRVLPTFKLMLSSNRYRLTDALERCRVKYLTVSPGRIQNLNSRHEYRRYIGETNDVSS